MPYVFREELNEGEEEAEVMSREDYDATVKERDELQTKLDDLQSSYAGLAEELDNAKTKFANAFLSSPQKMKADQADDVKADGEVMSFDTLFRDRNKYNAN